MRHPLSVGIVVLAAGDSSRMGTSKQLLPINGKPLLVRSLEAAAGTNPLTITVVLGAKSEEHGRILDGLAIDVVVNPYWQSGIGNSLKTGVRNVLKQFPEVDAIMVMVCDQPFVSSDHLNRLLYELRNKEKQIVASAYANTLGVPALFGQSIIPLLLEIDDEQGAKKLLSNPAIVAAVDFEQGATDLDTPGDYEAFLDRREL